MYLTRSTFTASIKVIPDVKSLSAMKTFAILALLAIHLFGMNSMYGLIYRNGYIDALFHLRDNGPQLLPGSSHPIRTWYTGIRPLDKLLTLSVVMFANVTDGTAPQLSLYGFYFTGQMASIFTVLIIEGLRDQNEKGVMSLSTAWGTAAQALGYGFIMPIWAVVHLIHSKTAEPKGRALAKSLEIGDIRSLQTLPVAFISGFFIPTVLMAIPAPSNMLHQWLCAFWQGTPVWIALSQLILGRFHRPCKELSVPNGQEEHLRYLHRVHAFAFTCTGITHLATFATLGARAVYPSLFSPPVQQALTFREVFVPPSFQHPGPMRSMAAGIHGFFHYDLYVGSVAALFWATVLLMTSAIVRLELFEGALLTGRVIGAGLLTGPGGAVLYLLWKRETSVLPEGGSHEDQKPLQSD